MARRVFFSFHFGKDIWRVNQVRNSHIIKNQYERLEFVDHAQFESLKRTGEKAVFNWIDSQLKGASVLIVLIGSETFERSYVWYEIEQAYYQKMGMLGIYIHNIKDSKSETDIKGKNPFEQVRVNYRNNLQPLLDVITYDIEFYDWVNDDGYSNIGTWVEEAARNARR